MKVSMMVMALLFFAGGISQAEVKFIGSPMLPVESLSKREFGDIFLGKSKNWATGKRITLVILTKDEAFAAFTKDYVRMSKSKFRAHWRKMVFSGAGSPPKFFGTEEEIITFIVSHKGAIGYIPGDSASGDSKIISLDK